MSQFTETMYQNARWSTRGLVTGEPLAPVRHTWAEVNERACRISGGLAAAGIGHGDAIAVLAGAPIEIAPTAQGTWMRGASLTMLHQPTPRTDLLRWADETTAVIKMIAAKAVVISEPFMAAAPVLREQDERGWYDTGDLGYLTEDGEVVVCGRLKDVIIMAGRNIYPTDIERAAGRVDGVRPGCAVAVRLDAALTRENFAVAVESKSFEDPDEVRRVERQVTHEVFAEVDVRPRNVVVLAPGMIPKTPSGKLRRAHALSLVT